jgi:threonine dehydrogenase-like Zn-dependent dehydrogenase
MRAVQVIAPGEAVFVEIPVPELKPGHALVRTRHLSLCGSDIWMIDHSLPHKYPFPPGTSGHEMIGVIEAVDPPNGEIRPGDLTLTLVIEHQGMAEYYLAPLEHVLPLPPGKPVEHLLQAQQLGTVIYASKRLPSLLDKSVAVIGQGSAGLWFNLIARRMGARQVIGVDLQAHRLTIAPRYGATHVVHNNESDAAQAIAEMTDGRMADVVIEAAGEISAINLAVDLAAERGFVLYFGVPRTQGQPTIPFAYERFFEKNLLAQTVVNAMAETNQSSSRLALEWIASGIADPGPMLTHRFPFDQTLDAYELQRTRDEGAVKIVIDMPE